MLQRMTALEYAELQALARHELVGTDREDYRAAMVAFSAHHAAGGTMGFKHFLPPSMSDKREQSFEEMLAAMGTLTSDGNIIEAGHPD